MDWPQIVWIILAGISLGTAAAKHGEKKEGTFSVGTTLIGVGLMFFILYSGGFFG